jgi:hypothetical protein
MPSSPFLPCAQRAAAALGPCASLHLYTSQGPPTLWSLPPYSYTIPLGTPQCPAGAQWQVFPLDFVRDCSTLSREAHRVRESELALALVITR